MTTWDVPESTNDQWRTPDWVFDPLNEAFGFTIDAAASFTGRKCERYWSKNEDGLKQSWANERVFCNPPWTKGQYGDWAEKAAEEYFIAQERCPLSVLLLPAKSPETKGYGHVWDAAKYLILPYKRIAYLRPDGEQSTSPNVYTSISVFTDEEITDEQANIILPIGRILNLNKGFEFGRLKYVHRSKV